jgi:hypothetical protein
MGMLATTTPATENNQRIPRVSVTMEDISKVGTVNIVPFVQASIGIQSLSYEELCNLETEDRTSNIDDLWKLSLSVRSPRLAWSGVMQMVHKGDYPGESFVLFLPMIDMDPGNMTCVQSTLQFICQHASRYEVTPIITFDQPLWWKALQVIESQPEDSPFHSVVLRLGGFHTQMSFIGSIGHLMAGSGLQELLETIYANNTVTHMLTGKAVQRAVRGLFLVDAALNATLVSEEFHVKPACTIPCQNQPDMEVEVDKNLNPPEQLIQHSQEEPSSSQTGRDSVLPDLEAVVKLHDDLLAGKTTVDKACSSEPLRRMVEKL